MLTVRQKGKATLGLFSFTFDNVREVEIVPLVEIRSHHISGDLESSTFTTRVIDVDGTPHIINIGRYVPKAWVPPLVGPALIGGETRKQFADIRAEILRRSARSGQPYVEATMMRSAYCDAMAISLVAGLAACSQPATGPDPGVGTEPKLPPPQASLLPDGQDRTGEGMADGAKPVAASGLR